MRRALPILRAAILAWGLLGAAGADDPPDPPAGEPPVAVATADVGDGIAPARVCFDARGSRYPRGRAFGVWWDFGDGRGTSADATPCHEYLDAGLYAATLTVTDDLGLEGSAVAIVAIREAP